MNPNPVRLVTPSFCWYSGLSPVSVYIIKVSLQSLLSKYCFNTLSKCVTVDTALSRFWQEILATQFWEKSSSYWYTSLSEEGLGLGIDIFGLLATFFKTLTNINCLSDSSEFLAKVCIFTCIINFIIEFILAMIPINLVSQTLTGYGDLFLVFTSVQTLTKSIKVFSQSNLVKVCSKENFDRSNFDSWNRPFT